MTRRIRCVLPLALAVTTTYATLGYSQDEQSSSSQPSRSNQSSSQQQDDDDATSQSTTQNQSQYGEDDIRSSSAFDNQQRDNQQRNNAGDEQNQDQRNQQSGQSQSTQQREQDRNQSGQNQSQDRYGNQQDFENQQRYDNQRSQQSNRNQQSQSFGQGQQSDRDGAIGVVLDPQSQGNGVRVIGVYRNSPADQAGIRVGDRILQVAGQSVSNAQDIVRLISQRDPRQTLIMSIQSANGQREDLAVRLSSRQEELQGRMTQRSRSMQQGNMQSGAMSSSDSRRMMQMLSDIRNDLRQLRDRIDRLEQRRGSPTSFRQPNQGLDDGGQSYNNRQFDNRQFNDRYSDSQFGDNRANSRQFDDRSELPYENTYGNQQFDRNEQFDRNPQFDRNQFDQNNQSLRRDGASLFDGSRSEF